MNDTPKVSAVIVNWNGAHHLRICLPSLLAQTFKPLEIIVVDNGSSDTSAEVAREFGVRWLPLDRNVGLAPALNRGAAIAAGEMLLFVNNDMRFDPQFVELLVRHLESSETAFATDGMQFNWDGSHRGHLAARLAKRRPVLQPFVELVPGLYFYQREQAEKTWVFMGSAACMLVRRTFFGQIHGFDERLPLGYEDAEICWRAWLHGWETVYVPAAICWHHVGASGHSPQGARFNFRGILTGRLLLAPSQQGREARSSFYVRSRKKEYSLIEVVTRTGVLHQVRAHLAAIGAPIVGDALYGGRPEQGLERFFLHARTLQLGPPIRPEPLKVESPLPSELRGVLARLQMPSPSVGGFE